MSENINNKIEHLSERLNQLKVLVIGDIMVDRYLYGQVTRISPEAPVPVVSIEGREDRLGGASNVALNCRSLGAEVAIAGIIGNDDAGHQVLNLLKDADINAAAILKADNRPTTIKTRVISRSQQLFRMDEEANDVLSLDLEHRFIDLVLRFIQIEKPDVVIFEDYDKGCLNANIITKIINHCKLIGAIIAVDPKFNNFHHYHNVDIFKPNLKEVSEALQIPYSKNPLELMEEYSNRIMESLQPKNLMITLSELGIYIQSDNHKKIIPAKSRKVADVSGAGDTVIAVAAMVYAVTEDSTFSAQLANIAGGMVCEYVGVVPINKEDWIKEINTQLNH